MDRRSDSSSFGVSISSAVVRDYHSSNTQFRTIISAVEGMELNEYNNSLSSPSMSFRSQSRNDNSGNGDNDDIAEDEDENSFFSLVFDLHPLDSVADFRLQLHLSPLNIVVSRPFITRIASFFSTPLKALRKRRMAVRGPSE